MFLNASEVKHLQTCWCFPVTRPWQLLSGGGKVVFLVWNGLVGHKRVSIFPRLSCFGGVFLLGNADISILTHSSLHFLSLHLTTALTLPNEAKAGWPGGETFESSCRIPTLEIESVCCRCLLPASLSWLPPAHLPHRSYPVSPFSPVFQPLLCNPKG